MAESAQVTVESELERLNRLYFESLNAGNFAVARQCCMDRLRAAGLLVDKRIVGIKPIDEMNPAELRALLGEHPNGTPLR